MFALYTPHNTSANPEAVIYTALHRYGVSIDYFIVNILTGIVGVAVVFLNGMVVSTLSKDRSSQSSHYIIANMAASDTFSGLAVIHTMFYNLINFQNTTECLTRIGMVHCFFHSSSSHLVLLTALRYVKIMYPFHYSKVIKKRKVIVVSIILWTVSFVYGILPLMGLYNIPKPGEDPCRYMKILTEGYLTVTTIAVFYPMCLMNAMYAHILLVAKRHHRSIKSFNVSQTKVRRNWRFTKTIMIICGAYCCCGLPLGLALALYLEGRLDHLSQEEVSTVLAYTMFLAIMNSFVNPIIYALKMGSVNRRFRQFFCRKFCLEKCPACLQGTDLIITDISKLNSLTLMKSSPVMPSKSESVEKHASFVERSIEVVEDANKSPATLRLTPILRSSSTHVTDEVKHHSSDEKFEVRWSTDIPDSDATIL